MLSKIALASTLILPTALACLGYEGGVPTPTAHYSNSSPIEIGEGEVFDAGWAKYDRGSGACSDGEGGNDDAVFILRSGATLRNVIIGKDQKEGVHCEGPCTLEFVWFEDVCEDAITVVRSQTPPPLFPPADILIGPCSAVTPQATTPGLLEEVPTTLQTRLFSIMVVEQST
jgi:hypothetical protein